jgi:uncharacterized protein YggE
MRTLVLILAIAVAAFAQVDGIATSGTRTVTLSPDEVTFNITVVTDINSTLEQAVAAVQDAGVTSKHLLGIASSEEYYGPQPLSRTPRLAYGFTITLPSSKLKETTDKLEAARRRIAADSGGDVVFTLYVNATEKAVQEARQRLVTELLAEAKTNAQFLANAAGLTLGNLLNVSENAYPASGVPGPYYGSISFNTAVPSAVPIRVTYSVYVRYAAQPR